MANYPGYNPYGQQPYTSQMPPYQPAWQPPVQQTPVQSVQPVAQTQAQSVPAYAMRAVSDVSEMYAIQVDFNGTPIFGWDMAHGMIYRRQFNLNTGRADLSVYRLDNAKPEQPEFVTVAQFNQAINDINERIGMYGTQPAVNGYEYDAAGTDGSVHAKRRKSDTTASADGPQ